MSALAALAASARATVSAAGSRRCPWSRSHPATASGETAGSTSRSSVASSGSDRHAVGRRGRQARPALAERPRRRAPRADGRPVRGRSRPEGPRIRRPRGTWGAWRAPSAPAPDPPGARTTPGSARSARRELVALDQRDARSRARQLVRTCGADDPAADDRDIRHGPTLAGGGRLVRRPAPGLATPVRSAPASSSSRILRGDVPEWPKGAAC